MADFTDKTLEMEDSRLKLPAKVSDIINIERGDVIVLLETTGKHDKFDTETRCRNVWRVSTDGAIRWKIHKSDMIAGDYPSFSGIWEENGDLWAYSTNGLAYKVDKETGTLGQSRQLR